MKVTLNNRLNYNVAFGYDKKLNQELREEIKKDKNIERAESISGLNNYCNRLEKLLLEKEAKKEGNDYTFKEIAGMFVLAKETLTMQVELAYDNLKYADRESQYYNKSFWSNRNAMNEWRKEARNAIAYLADNPPVEYLKEMENIAKKENEKKAQKNNAAQIPLSDKNTDLQNQFLNTDEKKTIIYYYPYPITIAIPTTQTQQTQKQQTQQTQSNSTSNNSSAANKSSNDTNRILKKFVPDEESPKGFKDVIGLEETKTKLKDGIIKAIQDPERAKRDREEYGIKTPRGLLLYGPPGCGKTHISKALSQEAGTDLYILNLADIGSPYVNQTSINLSKAFDNAIEIAKKEKKPIILFLDEIDTIATKRSNKTFGEDLKMVGTFLQAMDRAENANVFVIAATNKYSLLDEAVVRRISGKAAITVPDKDAIKELLKYYLSKIKKGEDLMNDDESLEEIAKLLKGYSNDSICKISQAASLLAMKRNRDSITKNDYITAIDKTTEVKPNLKEYLPEEDVKEIKSIGFTTAIK